MVCWRWKYAQMCSRLWVFLLLNFPASTAFTYSSNVALQNFSLCSHSLFVSSFFHGENPGSKYIVNFEKVQLWQWRTNTTQHMKLGKLMGMYVFPLFCLQLHSPMLPNDERILLTLEREIRHPRLVNEIFWAIRFPPSTQEAESDGVKTEVDVYTILYTWLQRCRLISEP